jgi:hypothetical protein
MERLRLGNITYMTKADYQVEMGLGRPPSPDISRIIKNVSTILSKTYITNSDKMELEHLNSKYDKLRVLSIV